MAMTGAQVAPERKRPHRPQPLGLPLAGWSRRERLVPYLFLAPTLAALTLVFFYPMLEVLRESLYRGGIGPSLGPFVGLRNYGAVIGSAIFPRLLLTSALYSLGIVTLVSTLGLATALILHRPFLGRSIIRALVILPWAVPYVAAALIWGWMLDYEFGVLNFLAEAVLGRRIDFLTACPEALISLTGVSTWKLYPFGTVMFLAALQTIPREHYEAAEVDGAGPIQCFWHITLPGVRNIAIFLTLLVTIWTFGRAFAVIFILTEGGPAGCTETIVIRTYLEAFQFFHPGTAAAMGIVVLLISSLLSTAYLLLMYRKEAR
jgi:multiple sugar transport system permease protein